MFNILNNKTIYEILVNNVGKIYPFYLLELATEETTIEEHKKMIIDDIDNEINSRWTNKKEKQELEKVKKMKPHFNSRSVFVYDLNGNLIKKFESTLECAEYFNKEREYINHSIWEKMKFRHNNEWYRLKRKKENE